MAINSFPIETVTIDISRALSNVQGALTRENFVDKNSEGAYTDFEDGSIVVADNLSYLKETGATTIADLPDFTPVGIVTPNHWGAVGDFNGSTGTNSTGAINNALTWWASEQGRHLHFPEGWYFYSGTTTLDLNAYKFNSITCTGQVTFGGTSGTVSWEISNLENCNIQMRLRNGGTLGDFTNIEPIGGTTAIKVHTLRWGRFDIEAMNYKGRVIHFTAGDTTATSRCRMVDAVIKTGNRSLTDDDALCGQPFYADSGESTQTGAFGKVDWRGEGCNYGPVFERLNDVDIGHIEAGKFAVMPMEIRGCAVVFASVLYFGATDSAGGANAENLRLIPTASGRLCGDFHIKTLRTLRSTDGIYASNFDPSLPSLRIDSFTGTVGDIGLVLEDIPSAFVGSASVDDMAGVCDIRGACGNIEINVDKIGAVTGDVVTVTGTVDRFKLSGRIEGGAGAGHSLVNLGALNNKIDLVDLDLSSDICDQLVNIGFTGANRIRCIGGALEGASAKFTSGRRPEYISGVREFQTESIGQAVIPSGTDTVTVEHGLAATPQFVGVTGVGSEASSPFITSINTTQITIKVPNIVTGDRTVYWRADATKLRGDLNA